MPTTLIIALLLNSAPLVKAIEDIINELKGSDATQAKIDKVAQDIIAIFTAGLADYDSTQAK